MFWAVRECEGFVLDSSCPQEVNLHVAGGFSREFSGKLHGSAPQVLTRATQCLTEA